MLRPEPGAGKRGSKIKLGAAFHRACVLDWAEINLFRVCALQGAGDCQGGSGRKAQPGDGYKWLGSRVRDSGLCSG